MAEESSEIRMPIRARSLTSASASASEETRVLTFVMVPGVSEIGIEATLSYYFECGKRV